MKRAKLSHSAVGQGGPGQPGCSDSEAGTAPTPQPKPQLPPPQQQQQQREQPPLQEAPTAASAPGQQGQAAAAWGVPQAHEVESYEEGQALGVVRRKPGRGEATLSMSCSDKLARWGLLGLQVGGWGRCRVLLAAAGTGQHLVAWSGAVWAQAPVVCPGQAVVFLRLTLCMLWRPAAAAFECPKLGEHIQPCCSMQGQKRDCWCGSVLWAVKGACVLNSRTIL